MLKAQRDRLEYRFAEVLSIPTSCHGQHEWTMMPASAKPWCAVSVGKVLLESE